MDPIVLGFVLACAAGAADLLGGSILLARAVNRRELAALVSISAGFILAVTLLERLPAAEEALPEYGLLLVLAGYLVLFLAENLFAHGAHHGHAHAAHHDHLAHEHHDHGHHHDTDTLMGRIHPEKPLIAPGAAIAAYVGLGIHTFFDGAAIVAGFLVDARVGLLLFVAVMLHKVPEGLSMASITMAAGGARKKALFRAGVLGGMTILGAASAALIGATSTTAVHAFLAVATGSFLYVAATDLIPAANEARSRLAIGFVIAGAVLFLVSERLLDLSGFAL